jgi:phosphatidylinositol-3-phosphatase
MTVRSAMPRFLAICVACLVAPAMVLAILLSPKVAAYTATPPPWRPDHIVVAVEENHSFSQIIDGSEAPFIQDLARRGALFTRSFALVHPSQPNYFALFSGSTGNVTDDGDHLLRAPTLANLLKSQGRTFLGYREDGSPRKHNPWQSFHNGASLERRLSDFPNDFSNLPTVSFVIPNMQNDMHDGSVAAGDAWLRQHLGAYAEWCMDHNSLLVVTFDEDNGRFGNRIPTIFLGERIVSGRYDRRIDHYNVFRTILAMYDLPPLAESAFAAPIRGIWRR